MKLSSKMISIAIIAVCALSILFGATFFGNKKITKATKIGVLRQKQLATVNEMKLAQVELILAAMDSIVDKDNGKVSAERMAIMHQNSKKLQDGIKRIQETANTENEKQLAASMILNATDLIAGINGDLVQLIDQSASGAAATDEDFAKIDNIIDENGVSLGNLLDKYADSVNDEVLKANQALLAGLSSTEMVGIVTFLIALSLLITLITLVTRSVTTPINFAIQGLSSVAEQVSGSAGQVSASSQGLAEGASEQAAAIEETSASMEEMASMTKLNAENASQADMLMKSSQDVIASANSSMTEMSRSMEDISSASEATSKIVKTIDEIAFQTNLLALNAAVEAARAGEAGAGFAVVADEVRNLAMRAAEAAKNTSQQIEGIVNKVSLGQKIVSKASDAFQEVANSSGKVGGLVGEISVASQEQAQGFGQINTAVTQMDAVTQQNSATAEETAAASQELNSQADTLMETILRLKDSINGQNSKSFLKKKVSPSMPGNSRRKISQPGPYPSINKVVPALSHKSKKSEPADIIPMDGDDDFEDF